MGGTGLERVSLVAFSPCDKSPAFSLPPSIPVPRERSKFFVFSSQGSNFMKNSARRDHPPFVSSHRMNVLARSLQYPHLLRRRHGDKPMFPVPRVLKEVSCADGEVMMKCFEIHADRRVYHLRLIQGALRFFFQVWLLRYPALKTILGQIMYYLNFFHWNYLKVCKNT